MGVKPMWRGSRKTRKKRKLVTEVERVTSLQLLGRARLNLGDETVEFLPNKRFQLLAYLAYQGDWVSRDKLVFLFWPDEPNHTARQNLRQLLKHIRNFTWLMGLESDESRLRWLVNTDVAAFRKALEKGQVERAVQLYAGALCSDLENGEGDQFHHWLELERQTLHRLWLEAALKLADGFEAHENFSQAARVFEKLDHAEPLAEDHLRRYLRNLALSEGRDKAREIFEQHEKLLKQEFNSEPEAETIKLIQAIRQGEVAANVPILTTTTTKAKSRHNLPTQSTAFVGREIEQKKLVLLLADSNCRLVTIVAPGGMGKTRLAIEVAKTQPEHFAEIYFVPFAAVASPDLMVYAVADALELSFFGSKPPKDQLLEYLKNKKMLLVLDNLEQLLSGIDLLHDILGISPDIKIVATSRERLQLQAEYVFDLEGLAVPNEKNNEATDFDSLQLFADRAKHNKIDFVLEPHLQGITRICQLVGGMPLAIELAASWSRLLTPNEILGELEHNLDLLSNKSHDLPERHHSMRSVFEVSWQRLSDDEQTALKKLSVFQGGFEKGAARAVADVDLTLLLSLVNKSFVWRDNTGRFSQHPLILQYIQRKASDYTEEKQSTEEKHGLYYLELFKEKAPNVGTQKGAEILEALEKDFLNFHMAWDWMLHEKRVDKIGRVASALNDFFSMSSYTREGEGMFERAVLVLDETDPQHQAALGHTLVQQAYINVMTNLGGFTSKIETFQRGLALLESLNEYSGIVWGQLILGEAAWEQGEVAKAKEILTSALNLARTHGSPQDIGRVLCHLILVVKDIDTFTEVSALVEPTLKELRGFGNTYNLALALMVFGGFLVYNDHLEEAEKLLLESLHLSRLRKVNNPTVYTLTDLTRLAYKRSDYIRAESFIEEAYECASKLSNDFMKSEIRAIWGRVKLAQGQLSEAERLIAEGLSVGWLIDSSHAVSHALVFLAELSLAKGQVEQAVMWLKFLCDYKAIEKRDRHEALKLLEKAKAQLSPQDFAQAQEASKSLTLEGIVTGILERGLSGERDSSVPAETSTVSRQSG
jgi:DNA-binding SARP family transcriptional activator/tetratricopeptide (TPR) repeat protein